MDVYGLGTVLYYMLVGKPYNPQDEIEDEDLQEILAHIAVHPDALNLIEGLLHQNPEERYTLQQVLEHPFMQI